MKKAKFLYTLIISLLAMLGCSERENPTLDKGTLSVRVSNIVVSESTKAAPTVEQLTVEVHDENHSYYSGVAPVLPLRLPAGSYTVSASYGTPVELDFDSPYYYAEVSDVAVVAKQSTTAELNVKLFNAIVEPVFDAALVAQFGADLAVEVSNGTVSQVIKPGETRLLYARAGQTLTATLRGTNLLGAAVEKPLADIHTLSATHHKIHCNGLAFQIPIQPKGNVWSSTLYVKEMTAADITRGDAERILANAVYEIYDGLSWSAITERDNGVLVKRNLTPNTSYELRVRYGAQVSQTTIVTEVQRPMPEGNMDSWKITDPKGKLHIVGDGSMWATRNSLTCTSSGINEMCVSYSGTHSAASYDGTGAEIFTCGWGAGNTYVSLWASVVNNITVGSLFLGTYDSGNRAETHGVDFTSRPTSLSFYHKYTPIASDVMRVFVRVENHDNGVITVLAEDEYTTSSTINNWQKQVIDIKYTNTSLPATHLCVGFYSGKNEGSKSYIDKNSNGGPWWGSRLYVDKVELGYTY